MPEWSPAHPACARAYCTLWYNINKAKHLFNGGSMKLRLDKRVWRWVSGFGGRLREDGAANAWQWLYGHGVPTVLGLPVIKYHRISDRIYVGPQHGKLGKLRLAGAGVTASINLRTGYNDVERGLGFGDYCQIPTQDGTPPTIAQLREGIEFIRRATENGGCVYIHCQTGLGRAPTMAAAYLISEGWSLNEACRIIHAVRPFTDIRPEQMQRLREFELESFADGH